MSDFWSAPYYLRRPKKIEKTFIFTFTPSNLSSKNPKMLDVKEETPFNKGVRSGGKISITHDSYDNATFKNQYLQNIWNLGYSPLWAPCDMLLTYHVTTYWSNIQWICVFFQIYERRHHCRSCGQLFCSSCSQYQAEIPRFKICKPVRVCKACYDSLIAEKMTASTTKSSPKKN